MGGGGLQPRLMRHPPTYLSKPLGGGAVWGGGGRLEGVGVDCESLTPTQGPTQQSMDRESLTPTQGATQQSVDCESLTPTQGTTQQSVEKRNKKERKNALCSPTKIWRRTWAGVLLQMHDLHFATNDICIAARLANLPLESTSQQTTFV